MFSVILIVLGSFLVWPFSVFPSSLELGVSLGSVFCLDYVGCCLSLLSILIGVSLACWFFNLSLFTRVMLLVSLVSSICCYCCIHAFWFWVFYEMTIIPLLVLLAVDSPYSERYVALWYFSGYVVLGSLPMLLCLLYFSEVFGSFDFRVWDNKLEDFLLSMVGGLLAILFITKIPLLPFHVWLPIVHAEASSPVSVCLSGYVMKLGVLGVFRFCGDMLPVFIFSPGYIVVCLVASVCFFFAAMRELDAKRWLAFFSLGHIVIAIACLGIGGWKSSNLSFIYCLGHGLSAAAMFLFIWLASSLSGTRNLMIMKHALWGSLFFRVVFCFVIGTVCCVPPTVQFFSELFLMIEVLWFSNYLLVLLLYIYVFLSGFVPVLFLSSLLSRHFDTSYSSGSSLIPLSSINLLVLWSFILFSVC